MENISQNFTKNPLIILITGASGAGKTTLLKALEEILDPSLRSINYFDTIGIPSLEEMVKKYGSGEKWQEAETENWIKRLGAIKDKDFIFLEGSFKPEFAVTALKKLGLKNYIFFCIHADRKERENRLIHYRKQPELVNQDMENFQQLLETTTVQLGGQIIHSEAQGPGGSAQQILKIIFERAKK